jgi:hypothetical protein
MRWWLAALVLLPAPLAFAGGDTAEAYFQDTVKVFKDAQSLLKTVKDGKTAAAARPKLLALGKRLEKLKGRGEKLEQDPAQKDRLEGVAKKYQKELQATLNELAAEAGRVLGAPGAKAALGDVPFLGPTFDLEQARRDRARADLEVLTRALDTYALVYDGSYPKALDELTRDKGERKAFVSPKGLLDPWGRPYRYEPKTLHPATGRPLVYSQGPRPGDPAGRIRNWTAPPAKKK